jgi:hypothetical protein
MSFILFINFSHEEKEDKRIREKRGEEEKSFSFALKLKE